MIKAKSYSRTTMLPAGKQAKPAPARFRFADLAIILVVIVAGIFAYYRYTGTHGLAGQVAQTKSYETHDVATALQLYKNDVGSYPTNAQGLKALVEQPDDAANWHGPYLTADHALNDAWNMPYQYAFPARHQAKGQYDIWSMGPDQISGTTDDIGNWN